MFEKSYSGKCRWLQVFGSIWRSKDWTITLVQSEFFVVGLLSCWVIELLGQQAATLRYAARCVTIKATHILIE